LANALVRDAALQTAPYTKRGILERIFARLFEGLVHAQIWEDPDVDLALLELGPTSRLVTIASGGCNVMSYLTADPMHIQAVDLNPAHVALLWLKLAAARHLPDCEAFRSFFAEADTANNLRLHDRGPGDRAVGTDEPHGAPGAPPGGRGHFDGACRRRRATT
jgi:S-adenosylmethionine-diacylglycerol 3-amino-3-carboxypropyl transferase